MMKNLCETCSGNSRQRRLCQFSIKLLIINFLLSAVDFTEGFFQAVLSISSKFCSFWVRVVYGLVWRSSLHAGQHRLMLRRWQWTYLVKTKRNRTSPGEQRHSWQNQVWHVNRRPSFVIAIRMGVCWGNKLLPHTWFMINLLLFRPIKTSKHRRFTRWCIFWNRQVIGFWAFEVCNTVPAQKEGC